MAHTTKDNYLMEDVLTPLVCDVCGEIKDAYMFRYGRGYKKHVCFCCCGESSIEKTKETTTKIRKEANLGIKYNTWARKMKREDEIAEENRLREEVEQSRKQQVKKKTDRWKSIRSSYGITREQYFSMLEQQNGGCAICGKTPSQNKNKMLFVDHSHVTGEIRGLCCPNCNLMLGAARDNPFVLKQAAIYVATRGINSWPRFRD